MFIPDHCKDQNMHNKALNNYRHTLKYVPNCYKIQKCVIKLSGLILIQCNLFLIDLGPTGSLNKVSILVRLY